MHQLFIIRRDGSRDLIQIGNANDMRASLDERAAEPEYYSDAARYEVVVDGRVVEVVEVVEVRP